MKSQASQRVIAALLICFVAVVALFALQSAPVSRTRPLVVVPPHSPPAMTTQGELRGTPVPPPRPRSTVSPPDSAVRIRPSTPPGPAPAGSPTPDADPARLAAPAGRWQVWFPYWPLTTTAPVLRALTLDAQGEARGLSKPEIDLGLQPGFPGPSLYRLHPSPDRRLWVAELAYGEQVYPVVLDLKRGTVHGLPGEQAFFYAWHPDSRRVLLSAVEGWLLVDVMRGDYELLGQFDGRGAPLPVRALAYSPDGRFLADALVYAPTVAETSPKVDVGLWEGGQRTSLFTLAGGSMVAEHGLRWSPDGQVLALIADVHKEDGRQTQLWTTDARSLIPMLRGVLAREVQYNHPPAWSPNSRSIAAITHVSADEAVITIFDTNGGSRREIRPRPGGLPSHLTWSKDGRWLLFSLKRDGYSEVWRVSPDGAQQRSIAGPMPADAPFALIESHE